jgi:DNA-directed RNA polymerase specialized sigma24 family protein
MNAPNTTTLLAAYLTTRTEHAYNALVRGSRSMLVATAHAVLRDQAAAEDVVQELLFAVRSMTVADLGTPRENLKARARYAALDARKLRRKMREVYDFGAEEDEEPGVIEMRSRRAEHDAWRRSGALTPEKAAELGELRAMLPEGERAEVQLVLVPSTSSGPMLHESDLQPMAQATMGAIVALLEAGEAPTAAKISARTRLPASGVRRYLTDLRRAGHLDASNNVLVMIDGSEPPARVEPKARAGRPDLGLTESAVRFLGAWTALVRETGARPTIGAVVDRIEVETGHRYGDTKRPLRALRDGGWIDPETGAVLRTLDGGEPPHFASVDETGDLSIVIDDAVDTDDLATPETPAVDRAEIVDALRIVNERLQKERLIEEDPRRRAIPVFGWKTPVIDGVWGLVDFACAPTSPVPPAWMIGASRASGLEPQRVAGEVERPRLYLSAPCAADHGLAGLGRTAGLEPPPRAAPPLLATGDIDTLPEPARPVIDWDGWESARERAEIERALSIGRELEDLDVSEMDPTDAGFHAPPRRRGSEERIEELRFPDPDEPGGGRRRKKKRRP